MANAIKQVSVQKGHDATRFALQCFGGAGGQHACLVADELGMETVFIHPFAGVLSAYGMGLADQTVMREQAVEVRAGRKRRCTACASPTRWREEARRGLGSARRGAGAHRGAPALLHLRYAGTEAALIVPYGRAPIRSCRCLPRRTARGSALPRPERPLVVEALAVEATAAGEPVQRGTLPPRARRRTRPIDRIVIWTRRRRACRAGVRPHGSAGGRPYRRTGADPRGQRDHGRRARLAAEVTDLDHLLLRRTEPRATRVAAGSDKPDPVLLELFNNLFMNVAEQMGAVLQNTSLSVNIKERLDFSCAVFDADGGLVANAPHIPVHLGAMGESVQTVLRLGATR